MWAQMKHAEKTQCPHGHAYSGDNLRINKKTGHRYCKQCNRDSKVKAIIRKARKVAR